MANLKLDLLNKLRNDKYYKELKLVRLAQDPVMDYEEKIELMNEVLGLIVEEYFKEPDQQPAGAPPPAQPPAPTQPPAQPVVEKPAGKVQPGQSHGEG